MKHSCLLGQVQNSYIRQTSPIASIVLKYIISLQGKSLVANWDIQPTLYHVVNRILILSEHPSVCLSN